MGTADQLTTGPRYVSWNYTYRCNFNCAHCYSRAQSYPAELSSDDYLAIADQLIEAQVFTVALGGGEVVLRKDCVTILQRLHEAGIVTLLTTNGWFIDEPTAEGLAASGLDRLYVSVDGGTAEEHDRLRRRPGSYDRAWLAVRTAVGASVEVFLSTVLTSQNVGQIETIVGIAEQHGVSGINFKRFRAAGNGLLSKDEYELREHQEATLGHQIRMAQLRTDSLEITLNYGPEPGDVDNGCTCGTQSIAIRPNGDVVPCSYAESVIGNLLVDSLTSLWRTSPSLTDMRESTGCLALAPQPNPSNPGLTTVGRVTFPRRRGSA